MHIGIVVCIFNFYNKKMKITFIAFILVLSLSAQAQMRSDYQYTTKERGLVYIDLSSGLDNHTGILGIGMVVPFSDNIALRAGAGLGLWAKSIV